MDKKLRSGFTLTELIVSLIIIFLLVSLMIPTTCGRSGESARRAACSNNMAQLAKAHAIIPIKRNAPFGGYLEPRRVADNATFPDEDPSTPEREIMVAWPTKLLPVIEQTTLHDQLLSGDKNFNLDAPPMIEVFNCPSDPSMEPDAGVLSYVVNSGMPDLSAISASQPSDLRANGIFHDQRPGRFGPTVRFGSRDFKDGTDRTILLSENIHRDPAGSAKQPGNTWLRPAPGAANLEQWYGMVWVVDPQSPRSPSFQLAEPLGRDTRPASELDQPYAGSGMRFARPASHHPDVFNVAFCGGNTREISRDIDYAVYQQLMTPDGAKAAPANAPNQPYETTLPADQRFMTPPLTDADY